MLKKQKETVSMFIANIHIDGFGKLYHLDLKTKNGINVLCGANEAGKSTIYLFLRSMFYGASVKRIKGRPSVYERMRPWSEPTNYGGSLDINKDGILYRISRDFNKAPDDLRITNLFDNKEEIFDKDVFMRGLLSGLSEVAYLNTVSAGQLASATEENMSIELTKYAQNISATANPKLNADKALKYLEEKKAKLNQRLDVDAPRDYNVLMVRGNKLEESIRDPIKENRILEYTNAQDEAHMEAGEAAIKLSEQEITINKQEKYLEALGIKNSNDIDNLENSTFELYKKEKRYRLNALIFAIIALILMVACILTIPLDFYLVQNFTDLRVILSLLSGIVGLACLIIAIIMLVKRNRSKMRLLNILDMHVKNDFASESLKTELETRENFQEKVAQSKVSNIDTKIQNKDEKTKDDPETQKAHDSYDKMKLSQKMDKFFEKLEAYKKRLDNIESLKKDREKLMDSLQNLNQIQSDYVEKLNQQRKIKSGVETDIIELGSLKRKLNSLKLKLSENKIIRTDLEAISIAEETLKKLEVDIKNSVGTYINKEAGDMLAGLSAGAYDSLDAGEKYNVSVNAKEGFIHYEYLSRGTIDQIYLALRIATIRFMTGKADPMPLILDDSFVLFDDSRLREALKFLAKNYKGQILLFSCQNRENKVLKAEGVPHETIAL